MYEICKDSKKSEIKSKNGIELPIESILADKTRSVIDNSCLTFDRNYLVIFSNRSILYIDSSSGQIVLTHDLADLEITIDYFLSPINFQTHRLTCLTSIPNSDHILALTNLNDLVFVKLTSQRLDLVNSANNRNKFDSFKVNEKSNTAIALDKINFELVVFNLEVVDRKGSFYSKNSVLFKISLSKDTRISLFGCHPGFEYIYVLEKKKILRIFTIGRFVRVVCKACKLPPG